jgi:hypothetical protein
MALRMKYDNAPHDESCPAKTPSILRLLCSPPRYAPVMALFRGETRKTTFICAALLPARNKDVKNKLDHFHGW